MRIVLEGLTGTGKSQTLSALRRLGVLPELVVSEDDTFGEVMSEIASGADDAAIVSRLSTVCAQLTAQRPASFLLERFHLSYYALVPRWELYDGFDAELAALGTSLVLLHVPEDRLATRSFRRREYDGDDWQALAAHYGSEERALSALATSQARRFEALSRTRLPHLVIDTTAEDWDGYAKQIADGSRAT